MAASKKLYITVAETIGRELFHADSIEVRAAIMTVASALADDFKSDNASFDRERFLDHIVKFNATLEAKVTARAIAMHKSTKS